MQILTCWICVGLLFAASEKPFGRMSSNNSTPQARRRDDSSHDWINS